MLGGATILSRIMGMVRDMVVSRLFGAGFATDAFFAAFQIPNMLRRFFAEGALTSAFVPIFSECYTQKGEAEARDACQHLFYPLDDCHGAGNNCRHPALPADCPS